MSFTIKEKVGSGKTFYVQSYQQIVSLAIFIATKKKHENRGFYSVVCK